MPDEVCAHFKDLGDYDYRPAREVADADANTDVRSAIDVDILGHIFEQSSADLERLRRGLRGRGCPGVGIGVIAECAADEAKCQTFR